MMNLHLLAGSRRWPGLILALACWLIPVFATGSLPPGEPTFFAGNPSTRQLAFRYAVGLKALGWADQSTGVYGLFGQRSFWYLDNEDRGYTVENNFSPEVLLLIDGDHLRQVFGRWPRRLYLGASYSHHSNGIDGDLSRSWNHANGAVFLGQPDHDEWSAGLKTWLPFNVEQGNEDIARYAGHGQFHLAWHPVQDLRWLGRTRIFLASRFSFDHFGGGFFTNLEADLSFAPSWLGRPPFPRGEPRFALFLQWFVGKGESLITYRQHQNTLRLGLSLW
jgi:outer membrane phospholipase A|nr:phospholipase A [Candidatus Krumholzibacteria bacterium]